MTQYIQSYDDGHVVIVLPIEPKTKKNSQHIIRFKDKSTGQDRIAVSQNNRSKQFEMDVKRLLGVRHEPLITYPCNIKALYYRATARRVDITNLNSALHDALVKTNILQDDDAKVVVGTDGTRAYIDRKNPRIEVYITPMQPTFTEGGDVSGKGKAKRKKL